MHDKYYNLLNKIILFIIVIVVLMCFFTSIHPTFSQDESFTFALINKNFVNLIHLDTMDVHPPLYYIILKVFLELTTFWTRSVFIKVVFSRILSLFAFILFFIYGKKLLSILGINVDSITQCFIILLFPIILKSSLEIRMYQLSATFLMLELYYLVKFIYKGKNQYIVLATLYSIFSSYTFYFAAVSAGLFLFLFFICSICNKSYFNSIKLFISGIVLILSYIPWFFIVLKQFTYHTRYDTGKKLNIFQLIKDVINASTQLPIFPISVVVICLLIYLTFCSIKIFNTRISSIFILSLINMLITLLISVVLCERQFQYSVLYPIFSILILFISSSLLIFLSKRSKFSFVRSIIIVLFLIMSSYTSAKVYKNIKIYDIPAITLRYNFDYWRSNKNHIIYLHGKTYPINKSMTASEDAVYLKSLNKDIVIDHYNYGHFSKDMVNNPKGTKFVKRVFPNLFIRD